MKAKIVLNPYANRWQAKKKIPMIESAFDNAGLDYKISITQNPGGGKQEALIAAQEGFEAVIAAGGDGTVNEVVNGLIEASGEYPTLPLGILPIGTGNDFNFMAGLPQDLDGSARVIAGGKTQLVDAGRVTADGTDHYFANNCALAMEPMVTIENIKLTKLTGNIRYIAALVMALIKLKSWRMHITWDGGEYDGPSYLLSICNGKRSGGLFLMAPNAQMDDGLFDFIYAPKVSKLTVISLIPKLFRGTHINHPQVSHAQAPYLKIESEPGTPIHADGEVITEAASTITYEILPEKITLLVS